MSIFNVPTIATLANNYKTYAQANSSKINPFVPYTDWEFKANAIAALLASAYQDTAVQAQAIFPQYRTGNQIDITLANLGLIPRQPATYAEILVTASSQVTPVLGYQITNPNTGAVFNYYGAGNNTNQYIFISNIIGVGYFQPVGTILNSNANDGGVYTVNSSVDGTPSETDNQCISRILNATVTPLAGGRITDYTQFALSANNLPGMLETLTAAVVIPAYASVGQPGGIQSIGVYGLVGAPLSEWQLNQGLLPNTTFIPYSRSCISSSTVATPNGAISTAIFNQKLVGLYPYVGSNSTYVLPVGTATATPVVKGYSIDIECQLVPGYTLASMLTVNSFDQFGNPTTIQLTIGQLIQREVRRVLVNQPFGATGTNVGSSNEQRLITLTQIEQQLDYQLGAGNIVGALASVILQRNSYTVCDIQPTSKLPAPVESTWKQNAIQVPAETYTVTGLANAQNIQFTYDISSYAAIGINLIGSYNG